MSDLQIDYKKHWEIARLQLDAQYNEATRLRTGIESWLKRMKYYTDKQYGVGEMKKLLYGTNITL